MAAEEQCRLGYILSGKENNPVILFLHGFMGSRNDWKEITHAFSDNFRCLAVDLPGHGESTRYTDEKCYTFDSTAVSIIALLDQLQIDRCSIVGYSMGGRIALYLTVHYPKRFIRSIIESASPGLKSTTERNERYSKDLQYAKEIETGKFEVFLERWYNQPLFHSLRTHSDFATLMKSRLNNVPGELAKSLRNSSVGRQPSLWSTIKNSTVPLMLLTGEYDGKYIAIATAMKKVCVSARMKIMKGCGHNIHFEKRNDYIGALKQFLTVS